MIYKMNGTCAKVVQFDIEDGLVKNVKFIGGCGGGLSGIAQLVEGMNVDEAIGKLSGIQCGNRGTSCSDQLSQALATGKE